MNNELISALMTGDTSAFNKQPEVTELAKTEEAPAAVSAEPTPAAETSVASPEDYSWIYEIAGVEEKDPVKAKETLLSRTKEYQEKIDLLSKAPVKTFHNENIRLFNDFVAETGVDDYGTFKKVQSLDVKSTDDVEKLVDAIVTREIFEKPELANVKDALTRKLLDEYNVEVDEDSSESEKALAKLKQHELFSKAKEAQDKFSDIVTKIKGNEPKPIDADALKVEKMERIKKWEPIINQNVESLKIGVPKFESKDGQIKYLDEKLIETNFDPQDKAEYNQWVRAWLEANNVPEPTNEMLEQAHSFSYQQVVFNKIPQLVADAYAKGVAEEAKKHLIQSDNPSALKVEQKMSGAGDSLSDIGKSLVSRIEF
jgi:hypothetical protein